MAAVAALVLPVALELQHLCKPYASKLVIAQRQQARSVAEEDAGPAAFVPGTKTDNPNGMLRTLGCPTPAPQAVIGRAREQARRWQNRRRARTNDPAFARMSSAGAAAAAVPVGELRWSLPQAAQDADARGGACGSPARAAGGDHVPVQ